MRIHRWLVIAAVLAVAQATAALAARPNILFILTDDQRWDTIHALGNPQVRTPALDALVERGFHFENAYCQGAMIGAVCLPSRTMILTGRSLWRIPQNLRGREPPQGVPLLPDLMNAAGYVTFHTGKASNACRYANARFQTNIESDKNRDSAREHADNVIKFFAAHDGRRPFFVFMAPPEPHDPRWAALEFSRLYDPAAITLSKNFMPRHPFDNGELHVRDEELAGFPRQPEEMRRHLAEYYASISQLDHHLGRVLGALEDRGWRDNTVVIFSSDQGLAVGGRHGLMGKQNLYEHVKPPLMIAGPGIPRGKSAALVYLFDLFPTICELAGVAAPKVVEGESLLPVARGEKSKVREMLFGAYRDCQRMVRDARWKLIAYNAAGVRNVQLFDLENDPYELDNLALNPKFAAERVRLEGLLQRAREQFDDPVDFRLEAAH